MQSQDSALYDESNFCNLKMLLDEKVRIVSIVNAIEENGICGRDFYDTMRRYSPKDEGARNAVGVLSHVHRWHSQALLCGNINDETWSRGVRKNLRRYGWYRHEMPNFTSPPDYPALGPINKPFSTKERNSYLKLIAALCKHSKIDLLGRQAVSDLRMCTEENELPLSNDTLRKILNELKDIIE